MIELLDGPLPWLALVAVGVLLINRQRRRLGAMWANPHMEGSMLDELDAWRASEAERDERAARSALYPTREREVLPLPIGRRSA